jgi:hypothetical protein
VLRTQDGTGEAMTNNILLDESAVKSIEDKSLDFAIMRIVKSSRWSFNRESLELSVYGPGCQHHRADGELASVLRKFEQGRAFDAPLMFTTTKQSFDLCLEDNWTGMFVARELAHWDEQEPLILVHLDDHTDMMPTLLEQYGNNFVDPLTNKAFNPAVPEDWQAAIGSGAITIGSYITALYHLQREVHVRHLNNFATSRHGCFPVFSGRERFHLLPARRFAAIRKRTQGGPDCLGSYLGGPNAGQVLANLPPGRLIVHIDLDYFINDFNGNIGTQPLSIVDMREQASRRMDDFFRALKGMARPIERWIVATSPGFCAARHWEWLLDKLTTAIIDGRCCPRQRQ